MECQVAVVPLSCVQPYVCACLKLTHADLLAAAGRPEVRTVKDLCRYTGAGGGCMACQRRLRTYIDGTGE